MLQSSGSHEISWEVKPATSRRAGSSGDPKVSYSISIEFARVARGIK